MQITFTTFDSHLLNYIHKMERQTTYFNVQTGAVISEAGFSSLKFGRGDWTQTTKDVNSIVQADGSVISDGSISPAQQEEPNATFGRSDMGAQPPAEPVNLQETRTDLPEAPAGEPGPIVEEPATPVVDFSKDSSIAPDVTEPPKKDAPTPVSEIPLSEPTGPSQELAISDTSQLPTTEAGSDDHPKTESDQTVLGSQPIVEGPVVSGTETAEELADKLKEADDKAGTSHVE